MEMRLPSGHIFQVDEADEGFVRSHKWHFRASRREARSYVVREPYNNGKKGILWLHRELMSAEPDVFVDHINGDGLDCRRANMRIVTAQQNRWNSSTEHKSVTGFRGVYRQRNGRFQAAARHDGVFINFGSFTDAKEAALEYDRRIMRLRGEFAVTNFPL